MDWMNSVATTSTMMATSQTAGYAFLTVPLQWCILTVAPSLMDMGLDFFPIWLLMLKPILETLLGAGGSSEESSSSSGVKCSDVRLTVVPSPPTVLQETGLVFTLSPSSCGPAWGKTTQQGEQQFPVNLRIIKTITFTSGANVTFLSIN